MNFSGKVGSSPRISAPSAPPEAGEAGANGEGRGEDEADINAEPAGDARIVDRCAQPAAEARAAQDELQRDDENAADDDDEAAIEPDLDAEDADAAAEPGRQRHELLLRAHRIIDRRDRHEDDADRKQHLVEMSAAVEPDVERALEEEADRGGDQERERERREERHAEAVHHDRRDVAPRHREGAVREVDEVHQPEGDRESAGEHEQEHAVGDTVEEDGQHGRSERCGSAKRGRPRSRTTISSISRP